MKKLSVIVAAFAVSTSFAAQVDLSKHVLGSGTPAFNASGYENAKIVENTRVENKILHSPQYMPNYPTAAPIWPRVVEVPCTKAANGDLKCEGYNWAPSMGRGEYLFVTPVVKEAPKATVVKETVVVPGPERVIIKEVPVKKIKE